MWSAGMFDDGYRPLVHALKYARRLTVGEHFGRRLGIAMRRRMIVKATAPIIVPVPLHAVRERERGYNQSMAIARGLARTTGFPMAPELLARVRKTKDQTKLTPAEREKNVRGAFQVRQAGGCAGHDIILVDDVMTTGATLAECARTVLADGASRVDAAVMALARAPGITL